MDAEWMICHLHLATKQERKYQNLLNLNSLAHYHLSTFATCCWGVETNHENIIPGIVTWRWKKFLGIQRDAAENGDSTVETLYRIILEGTV